MVSDYGIVINCKNYKQNKYWKKLSIVFWICFDD